MNLELIAAISIIWGLGMMALALKLLSDLQFSERMRKELQECYNALWEENFRHRCKP